MKTQVTDAYFRHLDDLSPAGNSFGFHIRFSRPRLQRSTYPDSWNRLYSERNYILCDPSVIWGMMHVGTKRWSEIRIPDSMGIFSEAIRNGLVYGVVVAHGRSTSKSFGSCARADREFSDAEIAEIRDTVVAIHDRLGVQAELKPHQIEALRALSEGLTYDEACARLRISRTALRHRLATSRKLLHASTNSEAVRLAIEKGHLESLTYTGMAKGLPAGPGGS